MSERYSDSTEGRLMLGRWTRRDHPSRGDGSRKPRTAHSMSFSDQRTRNFGLTFIVGRWQIKRPWYSWVIFGVSYGLILAALILIAIRVGR